MIYIYHTYMISPSYIYLSYIYNVKHHQLLQFNAVSCRVQSVHEIPINCSLV